MKNQINISKLFTCTLLGCAGVATSHAVNITGTATPYTQDFNTLANAGVNDFTLVGWSLYNRSSGAIATYNAGTGSSGTGSFYGFGSAGSAAGDRALGGVGSSGAYFGSPSAGSIAGWIALSLVNGSGAKFDGFNVQWTGEQWRNGGNTAAQSMVFEYGFGASFAAVSSWTAPGANFDWSSPVTGATSAAVDGNAVDSRADVGGDVSSLDWGVGQTLWLRWVERNDAGNDHGLAIDDFSFRAAASPVNAPDSLPFGYVVLTFLGFLALSHRSRSVSAT